ncbi:hypothetical protein BaRGS_00007535 [Batillaria attramentaria]|uniref:Uncharacterized protein n=1 Tax=Batillaria attramentaria TaxID=370345 RepID=A0ABD0LND3_9CAEN
MFTTIGKVNAPLPITASGGRHMSTLVKMAKWLGDIVTGDEHETLELLAGLLTDSSSRKTGRTKCQHLILRALAQLYKGSDQLTFLW